MNFDYKSPYKSHQDLPTIFRICLLAVNTNIDELDGFLTGVLNAFTNNICLEMYRF